ncbi:hypothetical protein HDU76_006467 [Blyttiomyces sp. JEL0837]|nr:hypothetical protein HDU76_006467 [Blyttiomyces sp. JEL0837]
MPSSLLSMRMKATAVAAAVLLMASSGPSAQTTTTQVSASITSVSSSASSSLASSSSSVAASSTAAAAAGGPPAATPVTTKQILFGAYDFASPDFDQSLTDLQQLVAYQKRNLAVIHFFTEWCQALSDGKGYYDTIVFQQKLPLIWDTMGSDIGNGKYDTFIDSWAKKLQYFVNGPDTVAGTDDDRRVYIRLGHEMNCNFYPWCPGKNSAISTQDYINFWRRTRSRFDSLGFLKSQIQWIWCPNNFDSGSYALESLYPGDDAADWVGYDAYNDAGVFGTGSGWAPPAAIMQPVIDRLNAITKGTKPIMASEIGTTLKLPDPGLKGKLDWLKDFYDKAVYLWNLSGVVYFNVDTWAVINWNQPNLPGWPELVNNATNGFISPPNVPGAGARIITDAMFWGVGAGNGIQALGGNGPVKNVPAKSGGGRSFRKEIGVVSVLVVLVAGILAM